MNESKFLSLSDITTGNACVVVKVHSHGSFRNRIMEMGFVNGEKVKVIRNAPLQDPIEYIIMGYHVSLRRNEASLIEVVKIDIDKSNKKFCRGGGGGRGAHRHVRAYRLEDEINNGTKDDDTKNSTENNSKDTTAFATKDSIKYTTDGGLKYDIDFSGNRRRGAHGRGHLYGRGKGRFWEENLKEEVKQKIKEKSHLIEVALVGNPNCGKTSIFNRLTGLREKVGNYSGVTVDAKTAIVKYKDYTIKFTDLPGTYSLTEYSAEEIYVRKYISEEHPDIVLNVVDSSNIERNLFLTSQLIDMNVKVVIAINMYDELISNGDKLDYKNMGIAIGIPIVPTTAYKGIGLDKILTALVESFEERAKELKHIHINYGARVERAIEKLKPELLKNPSITDLYVPRFLAIKLLEGDQVISQVLKDVPNFEKLQKQVKDLRYNIENNKDEKDFEFDEDVNDSNVNDNDADVKELITNYKFAFVKSLLSQYFRSGKKDKHKLSTKIDDLL
ncbi:MAG: FeoB small GTPase domain-containing protein, partial [Bacilli bacterium]